MTDSSNNLSAHSVLETKKYLAKSLANQATSLTLIEDLHLISLKGNAKERAFAATLKSLLGVTLPRQPNRANNKQDLSVLATGSNEWMIVSNETDGATFTEKLSSALSGFHHSAIDISDSLSVFSLSGPNTKDVLTKVSSLDLYSKDWRKGSCARCFYAQCETIIWQKESVPHFYLFVTNSYADYVFNFLLDALDEFSIK